LLFMAFLSTSGSNPAAPLLDFVQKHQNCEDQYKHADRAARPVAPGFAMRPNW
jgi:hypothetical protein